MSEAAEGRYYVAAVQPANVRDAVVRWLTTGRLRVSDPSSVKITEFKLLYLPYCRVQCQYVGLWQGELGEVDRASYNIAYNQHEIEFRHYLSLPKEVQSRIGTRGIPPKPREGDFVQWWHRSGHVSGQWSSAIDMCGSLAEHHVDPRVKQWANEVRAGLNPAPHTVWYSTMAAWSRYAGESRQSLILFPPDGTIADRFIGSITEQIRRDVVAALPKYYRGLQVALDRDRTDLRVTDRLIIPVYIVGYSVGNKSRVCLVDAITAETICGVKVRDISGAFSRLLQPFSAIFRRRAKPPRFLTYEGPVTGEPHGIHSHNLMSDDAATAACMPSPASADAKNLDPTRGQTIRTAIDYDRLLVLGTQAGVAAGGKVKRVNKENGTIRFKFKYGINLTGIRVELQVQRVGDGIHEVTAKGWFPDFSTDWSGAAPKKAQSVINKLADLLHDQEPQAIPPALVRPSYPALP